MQIQSTTAYSIFSLVASNREINLAHVRNIVESIKVKNLLSVNPITVNDKNEVLDGQHRLQAAKELGLPIFYIVSDGLNQVDISRLNTNKKNWTAGDYLNFWCAEGKDAYKKISKFINTHNHIALTSALKMLSPSYRRGGEEFKEGEFKIESMENAEKTAAQLDELLQFGKHVFSSVFIHFYCKLALNEHYDFEKMVYQIQKAPRSFVPCANEKQYIELFEEIYNRDVKSQNRVSFK